MHGIAPHGTPRGAPYVDTAAQASISSSAVVHKGLVILT